MGDLWVNDSSGAYDRISGIHLVGGLAAAAENRGPVKKKKELENVSIAKALQLEAARRRAVPIRFNLVARA